MWQDFNTNLDGYIALTDELHNNSQKLNDKELYKFICVLEEDIELEVDYMPLHLKANEMITLSPVHHLKFIQNNSKYIAILFNSNFYCIYGHDKEVSCNGFLFNGSSQIMKLPLSTDNFNILHNIFLMMSREMESNEFQKEEMLRTFLKQYIINYTRIARHHYHVAEDDDKSFDLIRKYFVLVDHHYKKKKMVKDYADMLNRSPKTLSNLFADNGFPSPLKIIHERIIAESKRLILYTELSVKEIGDIMGFEDSSTFSRFFKKMTNESIKEFRDKLQKEKI